MIILLEGNDKAGKTTIAKALVREDGFRRVHWGRPATADFGQEFLLGLIDELVAELETEQPLRDLVFDRGHLSELVYGPLDRGETRMTWAQMARIERIFQSAGTVLVWVDTEPYTCWARSKGTDDEAPLQRFEGIHEGYEQAYGISSLTKIRLTDVASIRKVAGWFRA